MSIGLFGHIQKGKDLNALGGGGGGGGGKGYNQKVSHFTADFHSKGSISETKGRRGVKGYIF